MWAQKTNKDTQSPEKSNEIKIQKKVKVRAKVRPRKFIDKDSESQKSIDDSDINNSINASQDNMDVEEGAFT